MESSPFFVFKSYLITKMKVKLFAFMEHPLRKIMG